MGMGWEEVCLSFLRIKDFFVRGASKKSGITSCAYFKKSSFAV